jgi:hypothetical protein
MRRTAKQYAARLGGHLSRAYGASDFYTPGQIRSAVAKLGLNPKFIMLGYAAFLPEKAYIIVSASESIQVPYRDARDMVKRYSPRGFGGSASFYESGIAMTGYNPDHSGPP